MPREKSQSHIYLNKSWHLTFNIWFTCLNISILHSSINTTLRYLIKLEPPLVIEFSSTLLYQTKFRYVTQLSDLNLKPREIKLNRTSNFQLIY